MKVLVTGMAGFMGSHLTEYLLHQTDWDLVGLVRLSHSGNLNRVTELPSWRMEGHRVRIVHHDLRSPISGQFARQIGPIDSILHIGALTHVDRSIEDPAAAVLDNVLGSCHLYDFARQCDGLQHLLLMSTDETFGPCSDGIPFKEWDRHKPANPYAATKCAAEDLALAYHNTYKLPVLIAKGMNIFAPYQHPEKMVPLCVRKILAGEEILIHADPTRTIPGARSYIHARNMADGLMFILNHGQHGDKYCVVGEREVNNLELAEMIGHILGYNTIPYRLVDFHSSRPGHDPLYRMSGAKLAAMGWKPPQSFEASLEETVLWFRDHPEWL